jgi:hypothetical protein
MEALQSVVLKDFRTKCPMCSERFYGGYDLLLHWMKMHYPIINDHRTQSHILCFCGVSTPNHQIAMNKKCAEQFMHGLLLVHIENKGGLVKHYHNFLHGLED